MAKTPRVWNDQFKKALILERPHADLDGYLRQIGIEPDRRDEPPKSEDELVSWLEEGGHNFIFKRSRVDVTERVVQATPNLFGVVLCCIGDDSVDKEACAREGVMVFNDPVSNGWSVVEMVIGEMICMGRRIFDATEETNKHEWGKSNFARYELKGKTLSIVGMGKIGKQVAQLASALGMKIAFYDNREVAQEVGTALGWRSVGSLKEAFEVAHVVTVHISANDFLGRTNENVISREDLLALGAKAECPGPRLFINAARGLIYRPEDLLAAIDAGSIEYAMVDVFPSEPKGKRDAWVNPYADQPRIFSTPHIGAATQEAQPRIARYVSNNVRAFNNLGGLRDCVFSPKYRLEVPSGVSHEYVLSVVHSDARGTKKAIDEAIYDAGLSNLSSVHRDFPRYGIAYDLNVVDGALTQEQIEGLIDRAVANTGDESAVRAVRMIRAAS